MKKAIGRKGILLLILCLEILFLGIIVVQGDNRERVHLVFDSSMLMDQAGESLMVSDQQSDQTVQGPLVSLSKGSYEIEIEYSAENAENRLLFLKDHVDYAEYDPVLNDFAYLPVTDKGEYETFITQVLLKNSTDCFRIRIQYAGEGALLVDSISIRTDESYPYLANRVFKFLSLFLLFDIICLLFLYRKSEGIRKCLADENRNTVILGIGLITLFASYPLFTDFLADSHDLTFHLSRIENVKDGLLFGAFPVRIGPSWLNGYGYASSVFYSDLLLYFPGMLRLVGVSLQNAYKCYVVAINLGTALIAYYCFSKLTGCRKMGLVLAGIYTLSIYRLTGIYVRGALGEFSAMMFLPLVVYGFCRIFFMDREWREYRKSILLLTIGLSGLIETHVLSCEMAAVFIFLFCLIFIRRIFDRMRFLALAGTVVLTLALNAWFLFPFVYYMVKDSFIVESKPFTGIQSQGMFWTQFFAWDFRGHGQSVDALYGIRGEMPLGIGWGLLLAVVLALFLLARRDWKRIEFKRAGILLLVLTGISMWMCTVSFPYDRIRNLISPVGRILAQVQFPWRYLGLTTLFLTFLCAVVLMELKDRNRQLTAVFAGAMLLLSVFQGASMIDDVFQGDEAVIFRRYGISEITHYVSGGEYLPSGADVQDLTGEITEEDGIWTDVLSRNYNSFRISCNAGESGGYFEIPLIHYIGYQALDEATGESLPVEAGKGMRLRINLPERYEGTVNVSFHEPVSWRIAEMVSLIVFGTLVGNLVYRTIAEKRKQPEK